MCRNVIKATIEVPWMGEVSVYSTQLDHLDERWRMKQIDAMMRSNGHHHHPHILAGGLNSLDASDYSLERWNDIVKVYIPNLVMEMIGFAFLILRCWIAKDIPIVN